MKILSILVTLLLICISSFAQSVEIEGALKITKSMDEPDPGTIRWSGTDFEGWTGTEWLSFTAGNKVQDGSGNSYTTIKIGDQTWLEQNLRSTKYNDGTDIPLATNVTEWQDFTNNQSSGMCWYNDDQAVNELPYGGLYNFYALDTLVNGNKNVCPVGFHVPVKSELDTLQSILGGMAVAGGHLKHAGTSYWVSPNEGANNASGFLAYPSGRRGPSGTFAAQGNNNYLRSSTEVVSTPNAYYGLLSHNSEAFNVNSWNRGIGMSVRCIRD